MKLFSLVLVALFLMTPFAWAGEIEMLPLDSTFLDKAGYVPEDQVMVIQMHNSSDRYVYSDITQETFDAFMAAPSKGTFYVEHIKYKFPSERE